MSYQEIFKPKMKPLSTCENNFQIISHNKWADWNYKIQSQPNAPEKPNSDHFWKSYLNYSYYSLMLPFRFVEDGNTGIIRIVSNSYQKILLSAMHTVTLLTMLIPNLISIISPNPQNKANNRVNEVLIVMVNLALIGAVVWNTWMRKESYFEAYTSIYGARSGKCCISPILTNKKIKIISFAGFAMFLSYGIAQFLRILRMYEWNVSSLVKEEIYDNILLALPEDPIFKYPMICLGLIFYYFSWHIYTFMDLSFIFTSLLLYDLVEQFINRVNSVEANPGDALEHFMSLQSAVDALNKATSAVTLECTLGSASILSNNVGRLFLPRSASSPSHINILLMGSLTMIRCVDLVIAAKANNEIQSLNKWIYENIKYLKSNPSELQIMIHQINLGQVALSPFGMFKIDYAFLGTFVGIVLSYAVVITQLSDSV